MKEFFTVDSRMDGAKGLVIIGDQLLVYRRDGNTKIYPNCIDLPGGGAESDETPFETFQRETREEFSLEITPEDMIYGKKYPPQIVETPTAQVSIAEYFPVIVLGKERMKDVAFGEEGTEYMYMSLDDYIAAGDAVPAFQERAKEYREFKLNQS